MSEPSLLRQWITRAKAGDAAAFEHLLALHSRMVLRTAQRLLLNDADAEDAAQDVFLRLHGSLSKFKDDRALVPWLYRITVNICHDMRRRRKEAVALEDTDEFASAAASAEQMLSDQQRRELMRRAISRLGERERDALVLRDLEGLTTSEVAAILGTSETTVRSQISIARGKVRQYLTALMKGRQ